MAPARESAFDRAATRFRLFRIQFPTLLDDYVLSEFTVYLGMILSTFLILLLVFTLFELLGDILRNQISPLIVGEYLLNVSPYFLYQITHIAMLLAVLITFGLMQRSNEITAMKELVRASIGWSYLFCFRHPWSQQDCFSLSSSICRMQTKGRMRYET